MRILIVEDEKAAARNLISLLEELDDKINVLAVTDSVVDSVEWLNTHDKPELIFMDIHLADGSAFDIFERCKVESPVIFTTAYDEYALRAFKVNSVDYLLKPISNIDLSRAIEKYTKWYNNASSQIDESVQNLLRSIQHSKSYMTHLLLPKGGSHLLPLSIADVVCFYIEDGVVRAKTIDGKLHQISYTLDQLAEIIDPTRFFRANRQYIITREDVGDIELWFGNRLSLRLKSTTGDKVIINKPRVAEFKSWFAGFK